jgi:hypothetical protein
MINAQPVEKKVPDPLRKKPSTLFMLCNSIITKLENKKRYNWRKKIIASCALT